MTSTPTTTATRGRINHPLQSFTPVLVLNGFLGGAAYFIAFLFSYGFRETIGWPEHLMFLTMIAIFATLAGLVVLIAAAWEPEANTGQLFAFGILTSLALNSLAVCVGSIVSALNKDQGSVSAGFSTVTDILVAVGLLTVSVLCARAAHTVRATR